jgi:site-specific recombinase XerD
MQAQSNPLPPSKETIEDAFHAKSTRRTYKTYQNQFTDFCKVQKKGLAPDKASASVCTDFFHYLYTTGKKAKTVESAKAALVAFFSEKNVSPNPARDNESKKYVVALQKYNKQNNIDEENKAHPVSVFELSRIISSFSSHHLFVGSMYRFLFCASFLGCFRISEVLNLTWDDVGIREDEKGQYVCIRLRWHKKAKVESDC